MLYHVIQSRSVSIAPSRRMLLHQFKNEAYCTRRSCRNRYSDQLRHENSQVLECYDSTSQISKFVHTPQQQKFEATLLSLSQPNNDGESSERTAYRNLQLSGR